MALAAVRHKAMVLLLMYSLLVLVCMEGRRGEFGPCFVVWCLIVFLVLQSSRWRGLLYFNCLLVVMWLIHVVFCVFSKLCRGLVFCV